MRVPVRERRNRVGGTAGTAARAREPVRRRRRLVRRIALALAATIGLALAPLAFPNAAAVAAPCDMSGDLTPAVVGSGVDGLIKPPPETIAAPQPEGGAGDPSGTGPQQGSAGRPEPKTNYERYGMAGQFWHTYDLGCTDMGAVLGNAWANTIFSTAKALNRLTITTYQAAATEGPLRAIKDVVDDIVTNLADALYWPYLRVIVILGAIWLAWYGLIRKRATVTTEGVIWMVCAVTVAVWFFSRPGDFTGLGATVTDKTGEVVTAAFADLPGAAGSSCLPLKGQDGPDAVPASYDGVPVVDRNADQLWSTFVCKPWLMGVFGTADPTTTQVKTLGAKLLDIQAIDVQEQGAQPQNSSAHQARYVEEVVTPMRNTPTFFLFQGKDWTARLGIAFGALVAAVVAGLLIFLVAVSLLVLKIGFLILLILGPVFLLIGVHPGSGRIIAMRWLEMLIGTLLRQALLALLLGLLVYGYALIMSTGLPWGMQITFMALLTIATFFYRRPFQHLFASMDGHTITTRVLGEAATAPTLSRAAAVLPPVMGYRVGRWTLRRAEPVISAAARGHAAGGAAAAASGVAQGRVRAEEGAAGVRVAEGGRPAPLETEGAGRRRLAGAAPRTGSAPPLRLSSGGSGGTGASGNGTATRVTRPAATRAGDGGGSRLGGWFSSAAGGWSRPSGGSSRASGNGSGGGGWLGGRSRGSSGGGGWFGGGSRNSGGSSRGSGGERARSSSSGGGLFGGSAGSSAAPRRTAATTRESGPWARNGSRPEPPPLWLPSRTEEDTGPFWLRPAKRDSDDD